MNPVPREKGRKATLRAHQLAGSCLHIGDSGFYSLWLRSLACMRIIAKSIAVMLTVCLMHAVVPSAAQGSSGSYIGPVGIKITHTYGQKRKIGSPQFLYPDDTRYHENHFEVIIGTRYKRSFWVHFARIQKVHFHQKDDVTEIFIVTDEGRVLTGLFPVNDLKISGKGKSGHVSYPISKIRTIEFNMFNDKRVAGERVMDRDSAAALLRDEWETARVNSSTWIVTDGDIAYENAKLVNIVDCFTTRRIGYIVHSDKAFRRCQEPESHRFFTMRKGSTTSDVHFDELALIEITGKKVNDALELVMVKKSNESRLTATYPISLEEDDMVVWKTPFGYEGIGILPLRRITIRAHDY